MTESNQQIVDGEPKSETQYTSLSINGTQEHKSDHQLLCVDDEVNRVCQTSDTHTGDRYQPHR